MRDQEFLLPPNMAEWLPEDHLVWFVLDVVDRLDTARFHAGRRTGGVGRQGYDPDMLLALLIYAYAVGERSSRRIERLCIDHVAFRVLCGQDGPDHSTIARFRAEHHEGFEDLFAQVLRLCSAAGMVKVGVVSIDGTKIAANASKSANRSHDWVREQAQRIAAEVLADADAVDAAEDAAVADRGGSDDDLPPGMATRAGRAAGIAKAMAELDRQDAEHAEADAADRGDAAQFLADIEVGSTRRGTMLAGVDPVLAHQARIRRISRELDELDGVRGKKASTRRAGLKRLLRDAKTGLGKAEDLKRAGKVDMRGPRQRVRDRRAAQARRNGTLAHQVNTTDPDSRLMTEGSGGGSVQAYNAQVAVTDDHLILGVHVSQHANDMQCWDPALAAATAQATALGERIELVLADAGYFAEANLTTEGPDRLIAPGKNREVIQSARDNPSQGPPPDPSTARDQMRHRMRDPENAERYKRRSATVEPVIAHLKDQTKLRRFARRGIQAATAELNLAAAVINLRRLHQTGLATG
ncbi:transposase [Nocardioides sp. NPDC051685]|uniref:transposase n=1 Tax=Nocardioides sp. NPDC051685 TaxID=3364334 RepID=UPI0037889C61